MRAVHLKTVVIYCILLVVVQSYWGKALYGQEADTIQAVVLHPIMNDTFVCAEHAAGELRRLGDALGKDCLVIRMDTTQTPNRAIPSLFQKNGAENEDWFGWEIPLLAPCDGTVESTHTNPVTNRPGEVPGASVKPASEIVFECQDGVHVIYAHPRNIHVQPGDSIMAGEPVAEIGNNAISKAPHVHIGAWKGETPLQIRFDLGILGQLRRSMY